ncbi:MAG: putative Ser/Thr protein phosphatase [Phycisphaerales bacterium]|nr:putative Ser/Thr protein phosphatase [Phycisphaerales bacterium]
MKTIPVPGHPRTLPAPVRQPWQTVIEAGVPRSLVWSQYTLPIRNLPPKLNGLRILHLTDIHLTPRWMPSLDKVLERVAANPPDLTCITGDFVEAKHDAGPSIANVRRLVSGLKSRLGIYGTLGNHDGDVLPTFLPDWPVRILLNEVLTLTDGDTRLEIIGLHGVEPCDTPERFYTDLPPRPANTLRLALVHFPSLVLKFPPGDVDVVMAGHTHGGQVCFPGGHPLMTHDPLPRRFARGVHEIDDRWLVVGRGIGFSTYKVRAFCPPEAIELTLIPADSKPG